FYFTIPYKPVNEPERNINSTIIKSNKKTLLVAEDEEYNFLLIEELLIDLDYLLIHAKNGQEAIDICEANPSVELVLMDIKMPVLSGDIAAKKIKEIRPGLPIIAQSAYGLEHEIKKYSGIFDDYVTKPFDEDQLISKINQYMLK
ncbi:MAG: response regulator, partial [Bacteroidales bacterium]|nr:response regulator [Bacteroidales bacterium]